jgi:hypothetical protein
MALLVPQPVKAAKLRQRRVGEQIRIRLVAHEYSLPRTIFGRGIESYVAELRPAQGQSSLARIYYRPMQYEPSVPLAMLDYSAVHRFRAVRDSGCDATMEAISFSDVGDRSGKVISQGPQPVAVPNVVGATQATAESAITGAGLTFTETQAYSSTVPSGSVISENPAAGTMVQPGTAVALVISQGPQPVAVPNVVGATQAAAEGAITGAGLTFTETQAYSSTVPSGSVISENPAAGTMVQPGTSVALMLSQGPQTFTVSGQIVQLNGAGPLAGATVSLGSGLTATTDGSGNFHHRQRSERVLHSDSVIPVPPGERPE